MQTYSNKTYNLLVLAVLWMFVGSTSISGQSASINKENDNLGVLFSDIANFHSETYTQSLRTLFSTPVSRFDDVLKAVASSNVDESKGAQRLIRYLGDRELLDQMLKSCSSRCFLTGAVPIPLHPLDVREIEYLMRTRDICSWGEFEMRYIYGIFFDSTAPANELRKKVEKNACECPPKSISASTVKALQNIRGKEIAIDLERSVALVRTDLFFLTEDERERAKLQFLGFNARKDRALFELLVDNGVLATRYFHVVFYKSDKNRWQFSSVTLASQS